MDHYIRSKMATAAPNAVSGSMAASLRSLLLVSALVLVSDAFAGDTEIVDVPLSNGDFSNGLTEWTVEASPAGASPPGSVDVVNGAARISKGAAFSTALSRSITAPDGLMALRLRIATLPQFGSSGAFIPEAFDINLTGANGFSRVATFSPVASAAANIAAVPTGFNLGQGVSLNGDVLRIPVAEAAAGEMLTLSATLVGASSDTVATVSIDDVVLEVEQAIIPIVENPGGCVIFSDSFEDATLFGISRNPRCALGQVGDTGITDCSGSPDGSCPGADLPRQDADEGRDALAREGFLLKLGQGPAGFDYTKLDDNGDVLPDDAQSWACVRDNFSGLLWEVKVDDPSSPSHHEHTFTWYEPDMSMDGGQPGVVDGGSCSAGSCDTAGLAVALNDAVFCGVLGWRTPTREELASLVHAGRGNPALATELFPLGQGSYWSGTPSSGDTTAAWRIDFVDGRLEISPKTTPLKVRLVREAGR